MTLTRNLIISGLIGFTLSLSPAVPFVSIDAQAKQSSSVKAANDMLAWNQQYNAAYMQLIEVYNTDSMQELFAADYNDFEAVMSVYSRFSAQREAILARSAVMFETLEAPERWNIQRSLFDRQERALYQASLDAYNGIETLQNNVREGSDFLPMLKLLEEGLIDEAISGFVQKQIGANKSLVENENRQIDGYLDAIPKDNPNHQFQKIIKIGNEMALVELDWAEVGMTQEETKALRLDYANRMENSIKDIPRLLTQGKRNQKATDKKMNALLKGRSTSEADKAFIRRINTAMKSFDETFEIEQRLYENFKNTIAIMRSDLSEEIREQKSDENDIAFFHLVDERMAVANARLASMTP